MLMQMLITMILSVGIQHLLLLLMIAKQTSIFDKSPNAVLSTSQTNNHFLS